MKTHGSSSPGALEPTGGEERRSQINQEIMNAKR